MKVWNVGRGERIIKNFLFLIYFYFFLYRGFYLLDCSRWNVEFFIDLINILFEFFFLEVNCIKLECGLLLIIIVGRYRY